MASPARNLWPMASPKRAKRTGSATGAEAFREGSRSGNSSDFWGWLDSKKVDRQSALARKLRDSWDAGIIDARDKAEAKRRQQADRLNREFLQRQAKAAIRYKGRQIVPSGEDYRVQPGDGSLFDSVKDAKRFVDDEVRQGRNPKKKRTPGAKAAARDAVRTYDKVSGKVYDYTLGLPVRALKGALGMKNKRKRICRNPEEDAAQMYEKFHGKPSTGEVAVEEQVHEHEHLATLGVLINMVVATLSGFEATIGLPEKEAAKLSFDESTADPDAMYLATNEEGTQLYIVGGDQSLDLSALKMADFERDDMVVGQLLELTYRTKKKFDAFKLVDYYHELGEETGDIPLLRYEPRSEHLYISGGKYKIKKPMIGMSPGIEN